MVRVPDDALCRQTFGWGHSSADAPNHGTTMRADHVYDCPFLIFRGPTIGSLFVWPREPLFYSYNIHQGKGCPGAVMRTFIVAVLLAGGTTADSSSTLSEPGLTIRQYDRTVWVRKCKCCVSSE